MLFTIQIGVRQTILVYHKTIFDEQGGGKSWNRFFERTKFLRMNEIFLEKDIVNKKQTVDERTWIVQRNDRFFITKEKNVRFTKQTNLTKYLKN